MDLHSKCIFTLVPTNRLHFAIYYLNTLLFWIDYVDFALARPVAHYKRIDTMSCVRTKPLKLFDFAKSLQCCNSRRARTRSCWIRDMNQLGTGSVEQNENIARWACAALPKETVIGLHN